MATLTDTLSGTRRAVTAPSRRDLLGAAGFTALAGIAAVAIAVPDATQPDAELIALRDQFMALQVKLDALKMRDHVSDPELDGLVEAQASILDEMDGLTATTLAGHRARVATLERWYSRDAKGEFDSMVEWHRFAALFRDMLGEAV